MSLSDVVREVQNPVLGGTLIWRFVVGYAGTPPGDSGCPLHLTFLVLPLLFHEDTFAHITSTRKASGLRKFTEKFATTTNKQSDILFGIHDRAKELRELSLESLQIARAAQLIRIDVETGSVFPLSSAKIKPTPSQPVQEMVSNAEKLGTWFSELSTPEITAILKVRF